MWSSCVCVFLHMFDDSRPGGSQPNVVINTFWATCHHFVILIIFHFARHDACPSTSNNEAQKRHAWVLLLSLPHFAVAIPGSDYLPKMLCKKSHDMSHIPAMCSSPPPPGGLAVAMPPVPPGRRLGAQKSSMESPTYLLSIFLCLCLVDGQEHNSSLI